MLDSSTPITQEELVKAATPTSAKLPALINLPDPDLADGGRPAQPLGERAVSNDPSSPAPRLLMLTADDAAVCTDDTCTLGEAAQ